MIQTGFDTRVKIQQIIDNQLPEFILDENPKAAEFLKQYYVSQEYPGGSTDIVENLDQYLKVDVLSTDIINNTTSLYAGISSDATSITVKSTKGYPEKYGLLNIDSEIITYTGIAGSTFTGCIRGFSGITSYHSPNEPEELVFSTSNRQSHNVGAAVTNLSALFLKEFYQKLKYSYTPGLENVDFISNLNVSNFIKSAKSFYQSKGTKESFRILFNVLYGVNPTVLNLGELLIRPSAAAYLRREEVVAERISGDPSKIVGQTIVKSTDPQTTASVSQVEIFTADNRQYYKLSLFVGYEENSAITGTFTIPGKTKVIEKVSVGSSVITVDSTIGFPQSGSLVCNQNKISYSDRSINQFFGCSGITSSLLPTNDIRADETVFAYEDGDLNRKVELRITGVLSGFVQETNNIPVDENEEIFVKNLGQIIGNSQNDRQNYKNIFANAWIYNTSSRYKISDINGSVFTLSSKIDKSSLKEGDSVEILLRGTEIVVSSPIVTPFVQNIDLTSNQVILDNNSGFTFNPFLEYDLRRKIKTATSAGAPLEFGNNLLTSDIQNVYADDNENQIYVASGSLPAYTIQKNLFKSVIPEATGSKTESDQGKGYLQGFEDVTQTFSIISFSTPVPFIRGDEIYYKASNTIIPLLNEGIYYVDVISSNKIRLYESRSFVGSSQFVKFRNLNPGTGSHSFILNSQRFEYISSQKILRKFNLVQNVEATGEETKSGPTGILINGVEIQNYKSDDKVYYGPLTSVKVLNGGDNYDVINPPYVEVTTGAGTTALIQPVLEGSVKNILVDPQDFDLNTVVSIAVTGGNGKGALLQPIIQNRRREVYFDARQISGTSGGLDITNDTVTFLTSHNFNTGDSVIYDTNGNNPIGISTNYSNTLDQGIYLSPNGLYFVKVINTTTIQLFNSERNALSGIGTVPFSVANNSGIHKFKSGKIVNTLSEIKVINGGSGFTNRKLIVKPAGISTFNSSVNFPNHGFNEQDLIKYNYEISPIPGLSTSTFYFVSKIDNDSFRLCDAGIAGTNISNYTRKNIVTFTGIGSGYQYFSYPPITVSANVVPVGLGTTAVISTLTATATVRGKIIDAYLYEPGSGYGSNIINLEKKPIVSIRKGTDAKLYPVVINGRVESVTVSYGGYNYYSVPDVKITGTGAGCIIRPVVENGRIKRAVVVNPGFGYTSTDIRLDVTSSGSGAVFDTNVRPLTINNNFKYGDEVIIKSLYGRNLEYSVSGYLDQLRTEFSDTDKNNHSPIIGWAYDGNPIYGPFGYENAYDTGSTVRIINPGYELNSSNLIDRPSGFSAGFFVEDYIFRNTGDLDESNGRFTKTPEFPNGVYAYFAGITTSPSSSDSLISRFPYFIGNKYRSKFITENAILNQEFNFNDSNLIRNTFPYKLNDENASNDFIIESNKTVVQKCIVKSVTKGPIDNLKIIEGGRNYQVDDVVVFDNEGTAGGGLGVAVSKIEGKDIVQINTNILSFNNSILTWENENQIRVNILPSHNLVQDDKIVISGLTTNLGSVNGFYNIGFSSYSTSIAKTVSAAPSAGLITDVYFSSLPPKITIGSSISIGVGTDIFRVLNVYPEQKVIRTQRINPGAALSATTFAGFIPDSFIIPKKSSYFKSKVSDVVYFNPLEVIGFGVTTNVGTSSVTSFRFTGFTTTRSIPLRSIFIENHPFYDNQQVTISLPSAAFSPLSVSTSFGGTVFTIPSAGVSTTVYIANKTKDTVGIRTQINTPEVFFSLPGGTFDSYFYSLTSIDEQALGKVQKIQATVSTASTHGLSYNDNISLIVNPNLSVGIGTSAVVRIRYDSSRQKVLVNPLVFGSSGINTFTDTFTIPSHELVTGDKIAFVGVSTIAVPAGITTGDYYVFKIDDNSFQLCQTYKDTQSVPPVPIDLQTQGGVLQQISKINPQITVIKNNDLVFDVSHPSLRGYNLKFYYDDQFKNEFVSIGNTNQFSVTGIGTIGVSTTARVTLKYFEGMPVYLYYTIEKSGFISTSDTDVSDNSKILFVDSYYSGDYSISGIGTTTFNISLSRIPEKSSYIPSECDRLHYSTRSKTAYGSIAALKILSGGINYKKPPSVSDINSERGSEALIVPTSSQIGKINQTLIQNEGFDYPSDSTLSPTAFVPPLIILSSSNEIKKVNVINSGKFYSSAPRLILVDSNTKNIINSGLLQANVKASGVESVTVAVSPRGIPDTVPTVIATNNSNGVSIDRIVTSGSGIVTCYLTTPILGFSTSIFAVNDLIYVENVEQYQGGTGYNSENYGYQFFRVTKYLNTNPAQLEYFIPNIGSNAGLAKTIQDSIASVINYFNYPQFQIEQEPAKFIVGESLLVKTLTESAFVERNVKVSLCEKNYIKVVGTYDLSVGDTIIGKTSSTQATVNNVTTNTGKFTLNYSSPKDFGWADNVGKLSEDFQVIANNDYYQNMAYTVKSPIQFKDLITPVNNLLHTSGLKNFADTGITSSIRSSVVGVTTTFAIVDIKNLNRVDTINNFDLVVDYSITNGKSNFLKLLNKKLQSYIKCSTNRVLRIDDISSQFSSLGLAISDQNNIVELLSNDTHDRFLIQIIDTTKTQFQLTELVTLNNSFGTVENGDFVLLEKGSIFNGSKIGDLSAFTDDLGNSYIKFDPVDVYNKDYDIKILRNNFADGFVGIATTSVGFVKLNSSTAVVAPGITTSLVSIATTSPYQLYASVQVTNDVTSEMNFVELYIIYDGTDTYTSNYYFNSDIERWNLSFSQLGSFSASTDANNLYLNYTNQSGRQNTVRSKIIGYGSTSIGIGTYRYILNGQIPGLERSARYESNYYTISTSSAINSFNRDDVSCIKSFVQVSVGSTHVLHQVLMLHDNTDIHVLPYEYLSVNNTPGIGTFGGDYSGDQVQLVFYPDPEFNGSNIKIKTFAEILYTDVDRNNTYPDLTYGSITESLNTAQYSGVNGNRINRTAFTLKYNDTPIFQKTFNPTDSAVLNPVTGVFTIPNHFYSTGEELIYKPVSSFLGVGATAVGIGSTANFAGIVTDKLPPKVYPIKITNDTFRLSTRRDYALSGIYVTFTSYGSGNAHTLTMSKKLERSIISVDGVVQYPISFTPINFNLNYNGGSIGFANTFFSLTGISSIKPNDILKIDDEYMRVLNVGFSSFSSGPITGLGTLPVVNVSRGFVGSSVTSHSDSTNARVYRGSFNIEGGEAHFTSPPLGNLLSKVDKSNLVPAKSTFDGRVYLRSDYTTNQIYDNISDQFTGIGQTYRLTVQGINTTGVGTIGGSGVLFINDLFQTPSTLNNTLNNYSIQENTNVGVTSVIFTGITSDNGLLVKSDYDVNANQLPRGGVIVSLGTTDGIGYAPLVGAAITATVDNVGRIIGLGIGSTGSWGSGYNFSGSIGIGISDDVQSTTPGAIPAFITAQVGIGGSLIFTIVNQGDRYTPQARFKIPSPSYSNIPVNIVSRLSTGTTSIPGKGLLLNINVAAAKTAVGVGSTYFEVESFSIVRPGYAFEKGDILEPVGLVTDVRLASPLAPFRLTVLDTFTDSFASWQFGDLDYIDSIKIYQDSVRTRFPLYYNQQLLSFEVDTNNPDSTSLDLNAVLLIFINGVIQDPGVAYQFNGGSSFTFTDAPKPEDNISIFFYRGTRNVDSIQVNVSESVQSGDVFQVFQNDAVAGITTSQDSRTIFDIPASDKVQTNVYADQGIETKIYKPISWTKSKVDQRLNGEIFYKSRDSIEGQIYPTAKIIRDISSSDTTVYVDDARFFYYEYNSTLVPINSFDALIVSGKADPVSAAITATVNADVGIITALTINSVGSGYTGSSINLIIGSPPVRGVGIGTTATATAGITNGSLNGTITITNPGLGYSATNPPVVFTAPPPASFERVTGATNVQGFSGIITGIGTTTGISGHPLALKFYLNTSINNPFPSGLATGFPIYIFDTLVGNGVTSVNTDNSSVVGIGTSFFNNIYYIHNLIYSGTTNVNAEIVCNVDTNTSLVGIGSVGIGTTGACLGRFSWGVIRGFTRSTSATNTVAIAVSGYTINSGLTTFPTIQRRGYGLRFLGALRKTLSP